MPMPKGSYKLTPEVQQKVVQAVEIGAPIELASLYAGLSRKTVWRWLVKGRKEEAGVFRDFALAVQEAEGKGAIGCLAVIRKAGKDQWQAAAWILERRYPQEFGRVYHRMEMSGPNGGAIEVKHAPITDAGRQRAIVQVLQECGAFKRIEGGGNGTSGNGADHSVAG